MVGLVILCCLFLSAVFGPLISPHSVTRQTLAEQNLPPSFHTGSEPMNLPGRVYKNVVRSEDLFICRCDGGADRLLIGVIYGGVAGYKGRTDSAMMRIIEVLYGLPYLLVVILLMVLMVGAQFHYRRSDRDGMGRHGADCQRAGAEDEA